MNNQTELTESRIQLVESLSKSDITTCFGRAVVQAVRGDRFVIVKAGPTEEETACECTAMKVLPRHPCLVRFLESYYRSHGGRILLELEYVGGGSLESYLSQHGYLSEGGQRTLPNGPLPHVARFMLFWQMVSAVEACHSSNVYHSNITLRNFMMCAAGSPSLKLVDFEGATQTKQVSLVSGIPGAAGYRAPEILAAAITKKGKYDAPAADVWSLGVCLYIMCTGMAPFPPCATFNDMQPALASVHSMMQESEERAVRRNCPIWASAYNLLQRMLRVDPKQRISIEEIKDHEFWRRGCIGLELPICGCRGEEEEIFTPQQKHRYLHSLKLEVEGVKCLQESEIIGDGVTSDSSSATTSESMLSSMSSDASATSLPLQQYTQNLLESDHRAQYNEQNALQPNFVETNKGNSDGYVMPRKPSSPLGRSFSPPARLTHYPCAAYRGPHDHSAVGVWGKVRRLVGADRF